MAWSISLSLMLYPRSTAAMGADDAGPGRQERVGRPGELGADGGGVAAWVGGDIGPGRGEQGGQRVKPGPDLQPVVDRLAQFGHGPGGNAVLQVSEILDMFVQGWRADAQPLGEQAHGQRVVANLVGQAGGRSDHVLAT
jgi:hypothetical protein